MNVSQLIEEFMQLYVKSGLPLGIAWNWVKQSLVIFREKPINFAFFGIVLLFTMMLPIMGTFLAMLILARIYLSANKVNHNISFGLELGLGEMLRQANLLNIALLNLVFDLLLSVTISLALVQLGIDAKTFNIISNPDPVVMAMVAIGGLIRLAFFGIAPIICSLNPEVQVKDALVLSWKFLLRNWLTMTFGFFILLAILVTPCYLIIFLLSASPSEISTIISMFFLAIMAISLTTISAIFSYQAYADGIAKDA